MVLPLVVAIGLVVLVLLLSGHARYPKGSLVKRAAAVRKGGVRVARVVWKGGARVARVVWKGGARRVAVGLTSFVVSEEELGGDGSDGCRGPGSSEQPGFASNHGFSAETTAAPSPYLDSEDMSLRWMMARGPRLPNRAETFIPEPNTAPETVKEEIIELATSPDHVRLPSSLSNSGDGQLGTSVESYSEKASPKLLGKLVRGGYRLDRIWEASRDSMDPEQFDRTGVRALGYSRVSFSSLNIKPRSDSMRFCVYERVSDDICTGAPRVVIACRGTATLGDLVPDVRFLLQVFHLDEMIKDLTEIVEAVLKKYEVTDVCIAGHSIGAAAALVVGMEYAALQRVFLDVHLFNPPFCALSGSSFEPVRKLTKLGKVCCRVTQKCAVGAVRMLSSDVGSFFTKRLDEPHHRFWALNAWKPIFYLHEDDVLCNGYIYHFRSMKKLQSGDPASFKAMFGRYVAPESVLGLSRLGPRNTHMVPSAELRIISGRGRASNASSSAFLQAHALAWWIDEPNIVVSQEVIEVTGATVATRELLRTGLSEFCDRWSRRTRR